MKRPERENDETRIAVFLGHFETLIGLGLMQALHEDRSLHVLAEEPPRAEPSAAPARPMARVVVLDDAAGEAAPMPHLEPRSGIVVLARRPTDLYGRLLLAAGVSCLDTRTSTEDLLAAIHVSAQGGCMCVSHDGNRIVRDALDKGIFTEREVQVLEALGVGRSYGEIALKLQISVATVKKHARSVLRKLGAQAKRDLVGLPVRWFEIRRETERRNA